MHYAVCVLEFIDEQNSSSGERTEQNKNRSETLIVVVGDAQSGEVQTLDSDSDFELLRPGSLCQMAAKADANKGSTAKRTLKLRKPILSSDHGHASDKKNGAARVFWSGMLIMFIYCSGHTSVFARLQAFLPHALPPAPTTTPAPIEAPPEIPESKYIKIRIVSWNMNESLPKVRRPAVVSGAG